MVVNRRTLIKALALAPSLSLLNAPWVRALMSMGPPTYVYLLLHGMFFMEFQGDTLYVLTPDNLQGDPNPHEFHQRPQGGLLKDLQSKIDFTQGQLKSGGVTVFPSDVPQFSASTLLNPGEPDRPILPAVSSYRCQIKLP